MYYSAMKKISIETVKKSKSSDGSIKYLYRFSDGAWAEAISFTYRGSKAICIATQVGCSTGCVFCASSDYKFKRNLTDKEMICEVQSALKDLDEQTFFDEVAFQGTGEPLLNLDCISKAAKKMKTQKIAKAFSLATSGVPKVMPLLYNTPIKKLYLSLHATDDETRTKLVPTNAVTGVEMLIKLAREHAIKTKIPVTINYLLLRDINDTKEDLERLKLGFPLAA